MPTNQRTNSTPNLTREDGLPASGSESTPRHGSSGARGSTRRAHVVSVRLSAEQLKRVDKDRADSGLRRGPYVRMALLGRVPRPIPQLNRDVWQALGPAFEHLARVSDSLVDRPRFYSEVVARQVRLIEAELSRIRREVLGIARIKVSVDSR